MPHQPSDHTGLAGELAAALPELRGRLASNVSLADITWFRVGGPAQVLFTPTDEADLAYFLHSVPDLPVSVIGLGSNLLVRDGGVAGIVVRLGRGFGVTAAEPDHQLNLGAAVPDMMAANAAANAGIRGLAFYRGIPGCIGGAVRMNAGAHGSETKDVLVSARALDRQGGVHVLSNADLACSYRKSALPADWIVTEALFRGTRAPTAAIRAEMDEVTRYREQHQPIRERTGGSTFKNPPGESAWKLIDAAGCRGLRVGGATVSEMHCNFLINDRGATAEDIERLGETVRARVLAATGTPLQWEIVRIGMPLPGHPVGEALVARGET